MQYTDSETQLNRSVCCFVFMQSRTKNDYKALSKYGYRYESRKLIALKHNNDAVEPELMISAEIYNALHIEFKVALLHLVMRCVACSGSIGQTIHS